LFCTLDLTEDCLHAELVPMTPTNLSQATMQLIVSETFREKVLNILWYSASFAVGVCSLSNCI